MSSRVLLDCHTERIVITGKMCQYISASDADIAANSKVRDDWNRVFCRKLLVLDLSLLIEPKFSRKYAELWTRKKYAFFIYKIGNPRNFRCFKLCILLVWTFCWRKIIHFEVEKTEFECWEFCELLYPNDIHAMMICTDYT